ncbi:MAG TPA: hypothetical protein VI056_05510 [Candidatus Limnocylindria bacterium]
MRPVPVVFTGKLIGFTPQLRIEQVPLSQDVEIDLSQIDSMTAAGGVSVVRAAALATQRASNGHAVVRIVFPIEVDRAEVLTASHWDRDFPTQIATSGPRATTYGSGVPVVLLDNGSIGGWLGNTAGLLIGKDEATRPYGEAAFYLSEAVGEIALGGDGCYAAATFIGYVFQLAVVGPSLEHIGYLIDDPAAALREGGDLARAVALARRLGAVLMYHERRGLRFVGDNLSRVSDVPSGSGISFTILLAER